MSIHPLTLLCRLVKNLLFHHRDTEYVSSIVCDGSQYAVRLWALHSDGIKQLSYSVLNSSDVSVDMYMYTEFLIHKSFFSLPQASIADCCMCGHMLVTISKLIGDAFSTLNFLYYSVLMQVKMVVSVNGIF